MLFSYFRVNTFLQSRGIATEGEAKATSKNSANGSTGNRHSTDLMPIRCSNQHDARQATQERTRQCTETCALEGAANMRNGIKEFLCCPAPNSERYGSCKHAADRRAGQLLERVAIY